MKLLNWLLISTVLILPLACKKLKTHTIKGKVINVITGQGIPNVLVQITESSSEGIGINGKGILDQAYTDANGNYSLRYHRRFNEALTYRLSLDANTSTYYILRSPIIERIDGSIVDLNDYFNYECIYSNYINDKGDINFDLKVVPIGYIHFKIYYSNITLNDSLIMTRSNQFYSITNGSVLPSSSMISGKGMCLSGLNTIEWKVYKNGMSTTYDTTIDVKMQDYNLTINY